MVNFVKGDSGQVTSSVYINSLLLPGQTTATKDFHKVEMILTYKEVLCSPLILGKTNLFKIIKCSEQK